MAAFDQTFPAPLAELLALEFDYNDGDGIDFEPYTEFQPATENADWIRAWTGNKSLDGAEYRIFGQDGTGGYAMFWLARPGKDLLEQPVVFFGSEGGLSVIARDFADLAWLLAGGTGPMEAQEYNGELERPASAAFTALAEKHAPGRKQEPDAIVAAARAAFPDFEKNLRALCG